MSTVEELNALYDSEILYMDYYIGQLLTKLKEYNLYDDTLIIATADHGELLGEHGKFTHGRYLYQEEIHIPLLIKYPHKEVLPARTAARIQLTDIIALILERLGMDLPDGVHGNIPPDVGHPIFSEVYPLPMENPDGYWRAIYDENFKFIWNSKGRHLLFNLEDDPGEKVNLFGRQQQRAA
jgi:arylsulfatase A-like enzyme